MLSAARERGDARASRAPWGAKANAAGRRKRGRRSARRAVLRRVEGAMVVEKPEDSEWWRALKRGRELEERAMRLQAQHERRPPEPLVPEVLQVLSLIQRLETWET